MLKTLQAQDVPKNGKYKVQDTKEPNHEVE